MWAIIRNENGVELNLIFNANAGDPAANVLMDAAEKYPGYTHMALRVPSIPATIATLKANDIVITQGPVRFDDSAQVSVFATRIVTSSSCAAATRTSSKASPVTCHRARGDPLKSGKGPHLRPSCPRQRLVVSPTKRSFASDFWSCCRTGSRQFVEQNFRLFQIGPLKHELDARQLLFFPETNKPSGGRRGGAGGNHIVDRDGLAQPLQRQIADLLQLGAVFHRDRDATTDEDLPVLRLTAQPGGKIGDRSNRCVVHALGKADLTQGRVALRNADAEA